MPRRLVNASLTALAAPVLAACLAGAAQAAQDRYGPPAPVDASVAVQPQPSVYLYWPGKTANPATTPQENAPRPPAPANLYAPAPLRPAQRVAVNTHTPLSRPRLTAEAAALRGEIGAPGVAPRFPSAQGSAAQGSAAPPTAAPPETGSVAQSGLPPRFYSVQRQYGVTAPVPLSPQFFADTSSTDLAAPPPAPMPPVLAGQAATGATAAAIRQRQAEEAASSDDGTTNN